MINKTISAHYNDAPMMYFLNLIIENKFIIIIINYFLLIFEALLFKRVLSSNDLIPKNNLFITFLYIVINASILDLNILQPILFVNLLLIFTLQIIFTIYNKSEDYNNYFNLGALISFASLFYFPSIFFFLFVLLSFLVYGIFKWREWVISFLGFLTTFIIYFSFAYLLDFINNELIKYKNYLYSFKLNPLNFEKNIKIFIIAIGFIFIFTLFNSINKLTEKSIFYRKKVFVLLLFFICSITSFFYNITLISNNLSLILTPVIFFITAYISQIKKAYISEILYFILLGITLYNFF